MSDFPQYKQQAVEDLIPYARNARTHSDEQVDKIAASIREFGFLNPVITDGDNGIVAGHGRVMAAKKLGMDEVPTVEAAHLTDAQKRAYILADNRLALDAGWDDELLRVEFTELQDAGFDLKLTGFELGEIHSLELEDGEVDSEHEVADLSDNYSRKIEAPVYEPTGECPKAGELYDSARADQLAKEANDANIPAEVREFLVAAAHRHTRFRYDRIAEYYAHATPQVQRMMEDSALVIVDYDKAVEMGFVSLSERLMELAGEEDERGE